MREDGALDASAIRRWSSDIAPAVGITEQGLVWGAGSLLARMTGDGLGGRRLSLEADRGRTLALLAVAGGGPVAADTLVHIEAAAAYWHRGDKALANLRLVFARLPRLETLADAYRLCLAEHLLDEGMTPGELVKELGLAASVGDFSEFWEYEQRVPARHGRESGRWTRDDGSFDIAGEEGPTGEKEPPEDEEERKGRHQLNVGDTNVGGPGDPTLNPFSDMISGAGTGDETPAAPRPRTDQLSAIARDAVQAVGEGGGPVYGTRVHTEFSNNVKALQDPSVKVEQSYLDGIPASRGMPGSVRLDVIEGPIEAPTCVYDLKTGSATLTQTRISQIRSHLPGPSKNAPILEIKP